MSRSISIVVLYCTVFLVIVNLSLYLLTQNTFSGLDWIAINVYNPNEIKAAYEYRGFAYFFNYLSTFPGLSNAHETVRSVATVLTGQFNPTDYNVVNAILGVLWVLWSPTQILFTICIDIFNMIIWIFTFLIPNWY